MAEADLGARDARGEWQPAEVIQTPAVFVWPPRPKAFLKWLFGFPGYLYPFNAIFIAVSVVAWLFLTPELERMARFEPGWMIGIYLRNAGIVLLWFGAWHLRLYIKRAQGTHYKYNGRWLSTRNRRFLFGNQTRDNVFWTLVSGVGVWSLFEALTMWMYANGHLPYVDFRTNPVYFVLLLVAVGLLREVHFYWAHRLTHWKPLYKAAHYLHHKNVNIGPWSGLSMHPIEHLIYFTGVFLHWIIPSHPLHAMMHLMHAGLSPAPGHSGFDELEFGKAGKTVRNPNYFHYLHHRYFECNYGGDGSVPIDRWFGSFHDGSDEAHRRMRERAHSRMHSRSGASAA